MIDLLARTTLWVIASVIMLGTILAVIVINVPVLLVSLLFDRHAFVRLLKNCRAAITQNKPETSPRVP